MPGRPLKSSAELAARGAFRHDPKRTRFDLESIGELTEHPPADFNLTERELHFWKRMVPLIPVELRAGSDLFLVASAVRLAAKLFSGGDPPTAADATSFLNHLMQLGLTEQGRRRLALTVKPEKAKQLSPDEKLAQKLGVPPKPDGVTAN